MDPSIGDGLWRLLAAAVCAAPIGWERGRGDHSAGFRTQILISLGSAAIVIVSLRVFAQFHAAFPEMQIDPLRAIQGILGGIGLLSAGAILRTGGSVKGFTTASTVWVVSAIGVACGFAYYDLAIALTVLTLVTTVGLIRLDPKDQSED